MVSFPSNFVLHLLLSSSGSGPGQVRVGEAQEGQEGQIPGPELYPIFGFLI